MSDGTFESAELPRLRRRDPANHKGDFGRVLLIGGCRGMAGAVALAGRAALRGGAGLVTLATADACLDTVAGFEPAYMTYGLPSDRDGRISLSAKPDLERLVARFDCVACGPGLGRSEALTELVRWLYAWLPVPLVVDADGLNALSDSAANDSESRAGRGTTARPADLAQHAGPRILTPHVGEFRRLLGATDATPDELGRRTREFAATQRVVLVLKGQHTRITDGVRQAVNHTGNPGLATGGSGDVLTGLILALLGQRLDPFAAAQLGAHVHGLAGDLAAQRWGQVGLIASDLPDLLPAALATVEAEA